MRPWKITIPPQAGHLSTLLLATLQRRHSRFALKHSSLPALCCDGKDPENFPRRASGVRFSSCAAALYFVLFFVVPGGAPAETKERIEVGVVENVVLLPWGVTLPARIDTGAAVSSLDARHLTVEGKTIEFTLPEQYGGQSIRLPIVKWMTVKSAGTRERRPVVIMELCIGSKRIRTEVNLNDRSNVKHPLLIGRNILKHGFIVACDASYCTKPSCPEVTLK